MSESAEVAKGLREGCTPTVLEDSAVRHDDPLEVSLEDAYHGARRRTLVADGDLAHTRGAGEEMLLQLATPGLERDVAEHVREA